jgi:hypothetical protein
MRRFKNWDERVCFALIYRLFSLPSISSDPEIENHSSCISLDEKQGYSQEATEQRVSDENVVGGQFILGQNMGSREGSSLDSKVKVLQSKSPPFGIGNYEAKGISGIAEVEHLNYLKPYTDQMLHNRNKKIDEKASMPNFFPRSKTGGSSRKGKRYFGRIKKGKG